MKLKTAISLVVICVALAVPGIALAASPTQDAYSGIAGQQQGGTSPTSETPVPVSAVTSSGEEETAASGTLPFTGLEVGLIAIVGVALLGGGAVLYRISRRVEPHV